MLEFRTGREPGKCTMSVTLHGVAVGRVVCDTGDLLYSRRQVTLKRRLTFTAFKTPYAMLLYLKCKKTYSNSCGARCIWGKVPTSQNTQCYCITKPGGHYIS